jgi:outer membrane protein OmpA-like peptidoglycan-associated protein
MLRMASFASNGPAFTHSARYKGLAESKQRTLTSLASDFKEYLTSKPDAHLELQGHADRRGTPAYNQALSERRVEITKRFLVGLGMQETDLTRLAPR